ncbi:SyrP protein [Alteromonas aestuariivivens]|uniref:SyrP protein n=1 Tax=Alteromonas aestuariivivens TaxID=1938339 RepID=A0A3D8ME91_9ALTE|nr:TauD/TfdA family dioxygenase [Alteromonas aestuariivivens]RDV28936.1 SyrP protein [Alteromonas aestuariivivens]
MNKVNGNAGVQYAKVDTQHTYDGDVFPQIVVNNANCKTLAETVAFVQANQAELEAKLAKAGALLFRGFPIDSAETFDVFSAAFGYPNFTYQESLSNAVRINFTERVFTANEAPKDVEIFLHHEMAQTPISPSKLFFFCQSAAEEGGATPLCRSDKLFAALRVESPKLASEFKEKGVKYTTVMPAANDANSGQGRSWKSTLSVETVDDAEAKLKELGYSWQWLEDGCLKAVTPALPAVIDLADGSEVFYNQLIAAYMGWHGVRENPSPTITFGDGSPIPKDGLERIAELAEEFTFDLAWQDGDVAIVDNYRAMHGRRPYSGDRKRVVLVALVASER